MKKENKKILLTSLFTLVAFALWTVAISYVDISAIGPRNSVVGFATINSFFHNLTSVNMTLYTITDWLGLVPISIAFSFAILGLSQWIKRKHILKVDFSILVLGGFYLVTLAVYILFQYLVINYRPVLINGYLEASYPSSTTMLVMCIMPTAIIQFNERIKRKSFRFFVSLTITLFIIFMVVGRLFSGVHWLTDIIGAALFSIGLVTMYLYFIKLKQK